MSSTRLAFLRLHGADAKRCLFASCVQARFTPDQRPQYVYSPRELSRWVRGVFEAVSPLDSLSPQALVRVWAHEALRLFHDRLTDDTEREWCNTTLDQVRRTPTQPSKGHTGTDGLGCGTGGGDALPGRRGGRLGSAYPLQQVAVQAPAQRQQGRAAHLRRRTTTRKCTPIVTTAPNADSISTHTLGPAHKLSRPIHEIHKKASHVTAAGRRWCSYFQSSMPVLRARLSSQVPWLVKLG